MVVSTLENLLNRNLPRSPHARELCAALAGRRIAIEVRGLREFLIRCDGARLVMDQGGTDSDVRVSGGPIALIACARRRAGEGWERGVDVSGDREVAERFRELARLLAPDLEEELALAIGDLPAHEIARLTRAAFAWSRHAVETTMRNVAEYFAHERGDLVSRPEARQLSRGIESVSDAIERLEPRLDALVRRSTAQRPEHLEGQ